MNKYLVPVAVVVIDYIEGDLFLFIALVLILAGKEGKRGGQDRKE